MERGSDKHGPRIDHELERETRTFQQGAPVGSHAQEQRETEGPGDDEPSSDAVLLGGRGSGGGLTPDEVEVRSEIAASLDQSIFPARRDALVRNAEDRHAREPVVRLLRDLPDGSFENVQAVWRALGGATEVPRR